LPGPKGPDDRDVGVARETSDVLADVLRDAARLLPLPPVPVREALRAIYREARPVIPEEADLRADTRHAGELVGVRGPDVVGASLGWSVTYVAGDNELVVDLVPVDGGHVECDVQLFGTDADLCWLTLVGPVERRAFVDRFGRAPLGTIAPGIYRLTARGPSFTMTASISVEEHGVHE
jgi:hypothetical protein